MLKSVIAATALLLVSTSINAQTLWQPPRNPAENYRDVWSSNVSEDQIQIGSSFNHTSYPNGWDEVLIVADWACGLYHRVPAHFGTWASSSECEMMGTAAAERSSECWHNHWFACAIPPEK